MTNDGSSDGTVFAFLGDIRDIAVNHFPDRVGMPALAREMVGRGWVRPHQQGTGESVLDFLYDIAPGHIIAHRAASSPNGFRVYEKDRAGMWHRLRPHPAPAAVLSSEELAFDAPFLVLLSPE